MIELEAEGYAFDFLALCNKAFSKSEINDNIHFDYYNIAKENEGGVIKYIFRNKKVGIGNYEDAKKYFSATYGIKFSQLGIGQSQIKLIKDAIALRHALTHVDPLTPMLIKPNNNNFVLSLETMNNIEEAFSELIECIHKASLSLNAVVPSTAN